MFIIRRTAGWGGRGSEMPAGEPSCRLGVKKKMLWKIWFPVFFCLIAENASKMLSAGQRPTKKTSWNWIWVTFSKVCIPVCISVSFYPLGPNRRIQGWFSMFTIGFCLIIVLGYLNGNAIPERQQAGSTFEVGQHFQKSQNQCQIPTQYFFCVINSNGSQWERE